MKTPTMHLSAKATKTTILIRNKIQCFTVQKEKKIQLFSGELYKRASQKRSTSKLKFRKKANE